MEVIDKLKEYIATSGKESFTWKECGVHYATLNALVRKGLLSKQLNGTYTITDEELINRYSFIVSYAAKNDGMISLKVPNEHLGMLCVVKDNKIYDSFDNDYIKWREDGLLYWSKEIKNWKEIKGE